MKKHFPTTTEEQLAEDIAEDVQAFIELKTGLRPGYEINGNYINFISWFDCKKFSIDIKRTDNLYNIQKQVHNYCKGWNNDN